MERCGCCHGKRFVPSITGDMRPCSRCNDELFSAWAKDMRSAEGRKPDRASAGQAAPPEGQPPAGGDTAREAQ